MKDFEAQMIDNNIVTYSNAVMYRNYKIYHTADGYISKFCFVHQDYDGAPDAHDHRHGFAASIDEAIILINEQIKEL